MPFAPRAPPSNAWRMRSAHRGAHRGDVLLHAWREDMYRTPQVAVGALQQDQIHDHRQSLRTHPGSAPPVRSPRAARRGRAQAHQQRAIDHAAAHRARCVGQADQTCPRWARAFRAPAHRLRPRLATHPHHMSMRTRAMPIVMQERVPCQLHKHRAHPGSAPHHSCSPAGAMPPPSAASIAVHPVAI